MMQEQKKQARKLYIDGSTFEAIAAAVGIAIDDVRALVTGENTAKKAKQPTPPKPAAESLLVTRRREYEIWKAEQKRLGYSVEAFERWSRYPSRAERSGVGGEMGALLRMNGMLAEHARKHSRRVGL